MLAATADRPSSQPEQLLFAFPVASASGRDDFLVGAGNEDALALVDAWPDWPAPVNLIVGAPGSGKSHLVDIWAARAEALVGRDRFLAGDVLDALSAGRPVALELGDAVGLDETGLFHILNAARQTAAGLLLTARRDVTRWPLSVPDLISRMRALPPVVLGAPDEIMMQQIMVKLFADRQTAIDASVLSYAVMRLERSFRAANLFVHHCDEIALRLGRKITKQVAAEALRTLDKTDM
ncbi:MAG: hypothetical protein AAGL24_07535 [Pseudomonadota bacterium]